RHALRDVTLEVDGRRAPLALMGVQFPSRREMSEGVGAIRLDLAAEVALVVAGVHQLSFRNAHLPELGVYLAHALVPTTDAIKITSQQRDLLQRGLQVDFRVTPVGAPPRPRWTGLALFGLCLALLFPWRKRLRGLSRRFEDERINPWKTFSKHRP